MCLILHFLFFLFFTFERQGGISMLYYKCFMRKFSNSFSRLFDSIIFAFIAK